MNNKFEGVSSKIQCTIDKVVLAKQGNYFVLVQFKSNSSEKSIKLRTQISALTNRPNFMKNVFTFAIGNQPSMLKFGLMNSKSQLDNDANTAMVCGVSSIPITIQRLAELPNNQYKSKMIFSDRGKEMGHFYLTINAKEFKKPISAKTGKLQPGNQSKPEQQYFNPLVSRVLYNQQVTDFNKLKDSIAALQNLLNSVYGELQKAKKQQAYFEKISLDLQADEKQIKQEIDRLQKVNSKIQYQLQSQQNIQNLKIQIDLLSQSQQGQKVLLRKVEYFQDRIYREVEENQNLSIQYQKIRPELEKNLEKAEEYANKLKSKQLQQFQLQKNIQIIKSYDQLLYQFKCNEETISSLANMSKKSELTSQQAKLLLSQAKYQVRLVQLNCYDKKKKNFRNQDNILKQIEKQIHKQENEEQKLSQQEQMVLKIKLSALQMQIGDVKKKLGKAYNEKNGNY